MIEAFHHATEFNTTRKTKAHWWNDQLTNQRRQVRKLQRKFKRERDPDIKSIRRQEYLQNFKDFKNNINKAHSKAWQEFCTRAGKQNIWSEPYYVVRKRKVTSDIPANILKNDGTYTKNYDETIDYLLKTHFPRDNEEEDNSTQKCIRADMENIPNTDEDRYFTFTEVEMAIMSIKKKKAPGIDGITPEIMKQAFRVVM
ncbi:uncharacterized protein LOC111633556 [Centruroides sculpturatus]|uniref:uncharacterized protein LOC111633556 n=1 Tax=Centruroides sculpturatus TaxID=218467 RepID=UPI000C6E1555|nr:uncharacterized protein LOC111633556 [Centruroides sculpturatus]